MDNLNQKSLKKRVIHSGMFSIAGHVISQGIRLGGNLISTRLLMPEMFGVMAIANIFFIGITMFSDLGIRQNIVQSSRGDDPIFLNSAWSLQIIRGVLLGVIVLLLSAVLYFAGQSGWLPKDSVYANKLLPLIIAVLSLTPLIGGLESTKMATARRHLAIGYVTVVDVFSQAAGPVVIIAWCYFDRSVWALVAGWFAVSLTRMILSHLVLPGINNKLGWDRTSLKELYGFGKWIFLSSILGFLLTNGDRLIFGAYLNASQLGIYSIAFLMVSAIEGLLRKLIGNISFPALSEIYRKEPERFSKSYYRFRLPIDLLSLFLVGMVFSGGQAIIDLLYDYRFRDAGWMLEILVVSLFFSRYEVAGICYLVLGKPKLLTIINLLRVFGVYVFVPIALENFGLEWAIWVVAANYLIALPVMFYFNSVNGLFSFKNEVKVLPVLLFGFIFGHFLSYALGELLILIKNTENLSQFII